MGTGRASRLHPYALLAAVLASSVWIFFWPSGRPLWESKETTLEPKQPVYYRDAVIVLMYHHLDEAAFSSATIAPGNFGSHMQMLKDHGYAVIPMERFLAFMERGDPVPDNAVLLTFDDGYESFYQHAYPILREYEYAASHFIVVKTTDIFNPDALPHLNWDQMTEMKAAGMGFYNHTYDQHRMIAADASGKVMKPALTNPQYLEAAERMETREEYLARIKADLRLANERLDEELGEQEKLLAFPYGAYNDDVLKIGDELGFRLYFTTEPGMNYSGSRTVYRVNAGSPEITADKLLERLQQLHGTTAE